MRNDDAQKMRNIGVIDLSDRRTSPVRTTPRRVGGEGKMVDGADSRAGVVSTFRLPMLPVATPRWGILPMRLLARTWVRNRGPRHCLFSIGSISPLRLVCRNDSGFSAAPYPRRRSSSKARHAARRASSRSASVKSRCIPARPPFARAISLGRSLCSAAVVMAA